MVTHRRPATDPAKVTVPSAAALTATPGSVPNSIPRLPGPYGVAGGRDGSLTGASTGGAYSTSVDAAAGAATTTVVSRTITAVIVRRTVLRMRAPRDAKGHDGEARKGRARPAGLGGFALGRHQARAQLEHG